MVALKLPRKAAKRPVEPYETVIVYGERPWWGRFPLSQLLESVPMDARCVSESGKWPMVMAMALAGAVMGVPLAFGPLAVFFTAQQVQFAKLLAGLLSIPVGGLLGAGLMAALAWWKIERQAYWIVRREWNEEEQRYEVIPVLHPEVEGVPDENPGVYRSDFWKEVEEMRDERQYVRGGKGDRGRAIQVGSMVILAVAMVIVLFFLSVAMEGA